MVNCLELGCSHFRRYGFPTEVGKGGSYIANFNLVDKRCAHPSVFTDKGLKWDEPRGVNITTLKECPNDINRTI